MTFPIVNIGHGYRFFWDITGHSTHTGHTPKMLAWIPWPHSLDSMECVSHAVVHRKNVRACLTEEGEFELGVGLLTQRAMSGGPWGSSANGKQQE